MQRPALPHLALGLAFSSWALAIAGGSPIEAQPSGHPRVSVTVQDPAPRVPQPQDAIPGTPAERPQTPSGRLLVLLKSDDRLVVHDGETYDVLAEFPTGEGPHEVAVSPSGALAVVSDYGAREAGNTLTVCDLGTGEVRATLDLGGNRRPHGILFRDETHVLVTTEGSASLLEVDLEDGSIVQRIETRAQTSHMVAMTPDGSRAFVANIRSNSVSVVDLEAGTLLRNLPTGNGAEGIDVSPNGREVWITNRGANTITVLDTTSLERLAEVPCGDFPIRAKFTPDGSRVLVSNAQSGDLAVFDAESREELGRVAMEVERLEQTDERLFGEQFGESPVPVGILVDPSGQRAFVANTNADLVTVVDPITLEVLARIPTGKEPDGLAWVPGIAPAVPGAPKGDPGAGPDDLDGTRPGKAGGLRSH